MIKDNARQKGQLETLIRAKISQPQVRPSLRWILSSSSMPLEENDNTAMDFVCDLLVKIAVECDIAVDAPHHTKRASRLPVMPTPAAAPARSATPAGCSIPSPG